METLVMLLSEVLLDRHELLPILSLTLTQDLIQKLQNSDVIYLSSENFVNMSTVLKFLAMYATRNHYYMRITDEDFQQLLDELKRISTNEKSVTWELVMNREGLGFLQFKTRSHAVLVDIELVGQEEEEVLTPLTTDDPLDDI